MLKVSKHVYYELRDTRASRSAIIDSEISRMGVVHTTVPGADAVLYNAHFLILLTGDTLLILRNRGLLKNTIGTLPSDVILLLCFRD